MKKVGKLYGKAIVETNNKNRLTKDMIDVESLSGENGSDSFEKFYKFEVDQLTEEEKEFYIEILEDIFLYFTIEVICDENGWRVFTYAEVLKDIMGTENRNERFFHYVNVIRYIRDCRSYSKDSLIEGKYLSMKEYLEYACEIEGISLPKLHFTEVSKEEYISKIDR